MCGATASIAKAEHLRTRLPIGIKGAAVDGLVEGVRSQLIPQARLIGIDATLNTANGDTRPIDLAADNRHTRELVDCAGGKACST